MKQFWRFIKELKYIPLNFSNCKPKATLCYWFHFLAVGLGAWIWDRMSKLTLGDTDIARQSSLLLKPNNSLVGLKITYYENESITFFSQNKFLFKNLLSFNLHKFKNLLCYNIGKFLENDHLSPFIEFVNLNLVFKDKLKTQPSKRDILTILYNL